MSGNADGGSIFLAPYNQDWPAMYSRLAGRIREALGERALQIEHVGSTSVPGLSAKPVIDVVLVVSNSADETSYLPSLEVSGFSLQFREPAWFEHRLLKAADIEANIHVFSAECPEIGRMLRFRDWLREHDDDRGLYEQTKRDLARRSWKTVQDYADAKSEIVSYLVARASA